MRTTLSLDPDVAVLIEREIESSKKSLKAVVNEKLRRGFALRAEDETARVALLPEPLDLGRPKLQNFDNIAEILELIDDDTR